MLAAAYAKHHGDTGLVGSVSFTTAGLGTWTVPPGVYLIDVVCVGAGGNGISNLTSRSGGGGGALCYKNSISVTPGQVVNYGVCDINGGSGPGSTWIFGLVANRGADGRAGATAAGGTATGGDVNFRGGNGTSNSNTNSIGGSAGTYTANGTNNGGQGIGLTGTGSTGTYGRGGQSNNGITGSRTNGVTGAIRIMWGVNKSFPANAA